MNLDYRYLPKKNKAISFLMVLMSFLIISSSVWGCIIYSYYNDFSNWTFICAMIVVFIIIGVIWTINERYIKSNCSWDNVSINDDELTSTRYGSIPIKSITKIRINDMSKVYSFYIIVENRKFKFSCLSFLGGEGGSEYNSDKEALKSLAEKLLQLSNSSESSISVGKESTSKVLLFLSCIAMLMLIPGFIYSPGRMIFVVPFVVPLFFVLWRKRKVDKK